MATEEPNSVYEIECEGCLRPMKRGETGWIEVGPNSEKYYCPSCYERIPADSERRD